MNGFAGQTSAGEPVFDCGAIASLANNRCVAEARIDARPELIAQFDPDQRSRLSKLNSAELILECYQRWGPECVERLLGDFSFALWDAAKQALFCARDQFGVKPFFYSEAGGRLVFGNALDRVRAAPGVPSDLNELAIADFLLFGVQKDPAATAFAAIQRLPAAHTLTWKAGKIEIRRYWSLPNLDPPRPHRTLDCVEGFRELLRRAVADRTAPEQTAVLMSGGLDSTMLAAAGHQNHAQMKAFTIVYDRLIPDRERHYSALAAKFLGMPIEYLVADGYGLYERADHPLLSTPEPVDEPLAAIFSDHLRQVQEFSQAALCGIGGDIILFPSPRLATEMLLSGQSGALTRRAWDYARLRGRIPPLGFRSALRRKLGRPPRIRSEYPVWLNPDLEARLGLRERWLRFEKQTEHFGPEPRRNTLRPEMRNILADPIWPALLERYHPSVTKIPVDVRHPLFDLRLVNFTLGVHPIPWFIDKTLARVAMRGWLPEAVRLRPKTPVPGDPVALRWNDTAALRDWVAVPALAQFVRGDTLPDLVGHGTNAEASRRLFALDSWIRPLTNGS